MEIQKQADQASTDSPSSRLPGSVRHRSLAPPTAAPRRQYHWSARSGTRAPPRLAACCGARKSATPAPAWAQSRRNRPRAEVEDADATTDTF